MKLIEITCPKCKATMEIDKKNKEMVCKYCNNKILIDEEVQKVKHMLVGQIDEEQEFINAETNLNKFKEYNDAYNGYESLSKRYVDNSEVWIGLLRSCSHDFTNKEYNQNYIKYWNKFISLASEKEIKEYEKKYKEYIDGFSSYDIKNSQYKDTPNCKDYTVITILLGWFGIHKFMQGKIGMGFLYLFTGGLFLIGNIIDIIGEIKRHPSSRGKANTCFGILIIILSFAYAEYSFISFLILFICGLLLIDSISKKIWRKPVSYSKYIKIGLLIVGILIGGASIPQYIKTWTSNEMEVYISSSTMRITKNNEITSYTYEKSLSKDKKKYSLRTQNNEYVFEYDVYKKTLCLIEDDECSITFVDNSLGLE